MHRRRLLITALILTLATFSSPATAQEATPTAPAAADTLFSEPIDLPELRITVTDAGYEGVPSELAAGRYLVTVNNASTTGGGAAFAQMTETVSLEEFQAWWGAFQTNVPHFGFLFRAPDAVTAEQVRRAMDVPAGGTPPADVGFAPEQLVLMAATQSQSTGTTQWLATNLEPGTYVLTCFTVDPEHDYRPHAFGGELTVLTVGAGGTPVP